MIDICYISRCKEKCASLKKEEYLSPSFVKFSMTFAKNVFPLCSNIQKDVLLAI